MRLLGRTMRFEARPFLCATIVTACLLWGLLTLIMYIETLRADFDPAFLSAFLASLAFSTLFFTAMIRYFRMRIVVDADGILIFDHGTPNQFVWSEVVGVVNEGVWFPGYRIVTPNGDFIFSAFELAGHQKLFELLCLFSRQGELR